MFVTQCAYNIYDLMPNLVMIQSVLSYHDTRDALTDQNQ